MSASSHRDYLVVAVLGLTQIIGYGTLYYSFSVLAQAMAEDFGWPPEWVFGVFSISLLADGLAAPVAGGWIDRHGAGKVMSWGTIGAVTALIACAIAPSPMTFTAGLITIELASTFVLYNAAFAVLVQINPVTAPRAITYLTLIAGFASTIFWPLTSALHASLSWREVYIVFAALHITFCLPIHVWLSCLPARSRADMSGEAPATPSVEGSLAQDRRRSGFILMSMGLALVSFVDAAILDPHVADVDLIGNWKHKRPDRNIVWPRSSCQSTIQHVQRQSYPTIGSGADLSTARACVRFHPAVERLMGSRVPCICYHFWFGSWACQHRTGNAATRSLRQPRLRTTRRKGHRNSLGCDCRGAFRIRIYHATFWCSSRLDSLCGTWINGRHLVRRSRQAGPWRFCQEISPQTSV